MYPGSPGAATGHCCLNLVNGQADPESGGPVCAYMRAAGSQCLHLRVLVDLLLSSCGRCLQLRSASVAKLDAVSAPASCSAQARHTHTQCSNTQIPRQDTNLQLHSMGRAAALASMRRLLLAVHTHMPHLGLYYKTRAAGAFDDRVRHAAHHGLLHGVAPSRRCSRQPHTLTSGRGGMLRTSLMHNPPDH
jgi:hypothetical protein